jgi:hypothetical protein
MRLGFTLHALFYSRRRYAIWPRRRYAIWLMHPLASPVTVTPWDQIRCLLRLDAGRLRHMAHHSRIRWYNPTLEDFEWRALPTTDEQALQLLVGSPYSATCTQTYREWRQLGASIGAALMRAGEAAKEQSEAEKRQGDDAR